MRSGDVAAAEPSAIRLQVMHAQASQPGGSGAASVSPERTLVNRYCVTCHNERRQTPAGAPLLLDKLDIDRVSEAPAVWEYDRFGAPCTLRTEQHTARGELECPRLLDAEGAAVTLRWSWELL